ncbi:MAG: TIGR04282 family arsenosugar biosynthesis glycosyltransferase [Robiginitomaculum sp.]|nr:TIGR04282 family arsenosugar biosynthesis glycosyltransferase [Robiginitomaculum sp.]
MKPRLYIFAKAPRLGHVKTRLAAGLGHVYARRIYRAMTAKVLREVQGPCWETILYVTPDRYVGAGFGGLWSDTMPRFAQKGGDLSQRSARLFTHKGPTIIIGTDTPTVKNRHIADGFKALKSHDAVIGPAKDGGFWLLGLNAPTNPGLFEDIRWSHPETCKDMCSAIDGKIAVLPTLEDVDDAAAYRRYKQGQHIDGRQ